MRLAMLRAGLLRWCWKDGWMDGRMNGCCQGGCCCSDTRRSIFACECHYHCCPSMAAAQARRVGSSAGCVWQSGSVVSETALEMQGWVELLQIYRSSASLSQPLLHVDSTYSNISFTPSNNIATPITTSLCDCYARGALLRDSILHRKDDI